ncbi:MAG: hypothetical protein HY537_10740 [Deltaproteobacteria bacterium]|nr:hypothetical protein [Deltaproteobacteria bacterium]
MRLNLLVLALLAGRLLGGPDCGDAISSVTPDPTPIEYSAWKDWGIKAWERLSGKYVSLIGQSGDPLATQTVVRFSEFSKPEQDLMKLLQKLAKRRKYVQRNRTYYEGILEADLDSVAKKAGVVREELETYFRTAAQSKEVEVSAIVVETQSGKKATAIFTDSNVDQASGESAAKAFHGLCRKEKINFQEVTNILVFHTHSELRPLSKSDQKKIVQLKAILARLGANTQVWGYAISTVDNQPLIFHVGG